MKVNDISNTCTYMCMYIISTNPFFMGDSKQILHLNKKKHLNQHSPRRQLSGLYIPWIYSGGLTLGVAKNLSKMTAIRWAPKNPF